MSELELPDEVFGFGSWLLWILATRATEVVDRAYAVSPARPSRYYGMVDGHPVPTPSLVAWLLTAAEFGVPLEELAGVDDRYRRLAERQKVLRTIVSRAVGGESRVFKDSWLRQLGAVCGLGDPEIDLLFRSRGDEGYPVDPQALRKAIARSLRAKLSVHDRPGAAVPAGKVVVGEIPREPPGFVVRDLLQQLADAAGRGQVAVVCAVTGLRGVGKTQLAAAYARYRASAGWRLVGWVNAESRGTLVADLARIADRVGVADPEGDSAESARRLRGHLEASAREGLLVFDNADSPDELRPFLPATGGTQVVVTSTDQAFAELGELVAVEVFSRAESVGYLAARTGLDDADGADAVAAALGDLPLALAQAAATIRRQHLRYQEYLQRLCSIPVQALLGRVPGGDYAQPAAAALLLSIQAGEASDPSGLAGRLLRVVAALSADGVGRILLGGMVPPGRTAEAGWGSEVELVVERCVAGSLLTWSVTGDAVIMHRLLGRVLRERDQVSGCWPATVTDALELLEVRMFPPEQAFPRRDEGAGLVAHIEALWQASAGIGGIGPDLQVRQLRARAWAVRQLRAAADLSRAMDLGTRVLADCRLVLGDDDADTLTVQGELAVACANAGRLQDAIMLHEKTLADRERVLGAGHPDTLTSRSDLAETYEDAGRLQEAIWHHERALADRERFLGADHPDTLYSSGCLACAYVTAGRLQEAIALHEKTLADRERVLGADHPHTLISRNDLAYAYQSAGRMGQAIPLFERALADRERVLGADHPHTLISRDNLAAAYHLAGRLDQAIPLYLRSLADFDRVLGADHPDTLISRGNLARAYQAAGRLDQAIPAYEQAVAEFERALGADHPYTLKCRDYMAAAYRSAGRVEQAIVLHERTLADRRRILGASHPDTLASQDNLAHAYQAAGRHKQAMVLFEQTLADREHVLGIDHPDTLASRSSLDQARAQ